MERETDQVIKDRQDKELEEARRERQERLGHSATRSEEEAPKPESETV